MASMMEFEGCAGVHLRADVHGDERHPPVLLLHGGGQSHLIWNDVVEALVASERRVINLDLRGHGESDWPEQAHYETEAFVDDIRAVVEQLEQRPVIVAATTACWIAARALAGAAGNLAAGLVLVDLPLDPSAEAVARARDMLSRQCAATEKPVFDQRWLDRQPTTPLLGLADSIAPQLRLPVLVVRGTRSNIASEEAVTAFVANLPDAERVDIEDTRLVVTDDRFDELSQALIAFLERRQPRDPSEYRSGSDPRTLRDALGCFATGVTVVTATAGNGVPKGATVNSFTSVSLDPPLLLVCLKRDSESAQTLSDAKHFAVNVLQSGQRAASTCFASRGVDRFAQVDWKPGEFGAPILEDSLCVFECRQFSLQEAGDHLILVGRVEKAHFRTFRDPLIYFRGGYRRLNYRAR